MYEFTFPRIFFQAPNDPPSLAPSPFHRDQPIYRISTVPHGWKRKREREEREKRSPSNVQPSISMGQPLIKPRLPIIRISCRSIDERSQRLRLHQGARLAKSHAQETTATTSGASSRGRAMENRRLLAQRGTPIRLLGDDDRSVRSFNYSGVHSTRAKARFKDVIERVPMLAMALLSTSSGKYRWVSQWAEVSWIIYEWSLNVRVRVTFAEWKRWWRRCG